MFQFEWIQQSGINDVTEKENMMVKVPLNRKEEVVGEARLR